MRRRVRAGLVALSLLVPLAAGCDAETGRATPAGTERARSPAATPPAVTPPPGETPSGSPSPEPPVSRRVEFSSPAGERLVGRLFGRAGRRAVVLAHQSDGDQTDRYEFAAVLASSGYTALTFNFEGYCGGGCSRGGLPTAELWTDIVAAVGFLEDRGATRIGLIGASLGGEASIAAAAHLGDRVSALVSLSASLGLAEIGIGGARRDASSITSPKLFVAGSSDASAAEAARFFERAAGEPKHLAILPFGEHGVDLLRWEAGERARPLVLSFLERALR